MVSDRTEEEQVEALKSWFAENGVSLVVGIVLSLTAVFGYRAWENSNRQTGEAASQIYQQLVEAVGNAPTEGLSDEMVATGTSLAERLKTEYGDTSYALFGASYLAKIAVTNGKLDEAVAQLQWILDNGVEGSLEILTRIRLAKVLIMQEKYEQALALLDVKRDMYAYQSSWDETRGDIYFAMGNKEQAREAYQFALQNETNAAASPYLSMKLEDLTYSHEQQSDAGNKKEAVESTAESNTGADVETGAGEE